jgi:hypothetical protein
MSKVHGASNSDSAANEDSATLLLAPPGSGPTAEVPALSLPTRRNSAPGRRVIRRRREVRRRSAKIAAALTALALIPAVVVIYERAGSSAQSPATASTVSQAYPLTKYPNGHWHGWHHGRRPTAGPTTTPSASPTKPKPTPSSSTTTSKPSTTTSAPSASGSAPTGVPKSGLPAGTTLKSMGEQTITKDGTVIDGADINGGVVVAASNVVIRRSKIEGQGPFGVYVRSGSLTFEDSTVTGFDNSVAGDNYTATRIEVTKANDDGFKIGDHVTIQDSYCHDLVIVPGAHSDCGQVQAGVTNSVIRGNWFDIGNGDGNSALFLAPDLGPSTSGPLTVEDNVLGGGNFTVQCVDGDNGTYFIKNITIRNNTFINNSRYGPLRVNVPASISGNVMQGTKKAISY